MRIKASFSGKTSANVRSTGEASYGPSSGSRDPKGDLRSASPKSATSNKDRSKVVDCLLPPHNALSENADGSSSVRSTMLMTPPS
eukprot:CAMPEP_0194761244 /NCGR_PEP_ID=MMETSP0323_2-20130528/13988_1 /TAXON_ID=2866 ORGANISM="Crypthecodinium cohnii, Strain Seligo" /NCGR_SAMPLE_ID=MMETSP0323_2 /ASSEMBLY_ACC=CAM_ASM_000346 /LENGTH=84 /DNA_ID=CAMNT_0039682887 /DNA_START=159 /DNA_END=409 /DNA_ORIENTATION=-